MVKKKMYLAGPISSDPDYFKKFEAYEDFMSKQGYAILNPARAPEGMTYRQYIHYGIVLLGKADCICFLPNSNKSPGAQFEKHYANLVGLPYIEL